MENEDCQTVAAKSHQIKGTASNVGGMALSALAFTMEQAGNAGALETLHQTLPEIENRFAQLKTVMEKIL